MTLKSIKWCMQTKNKNILHVNRKLHPMQRFALYAPYTTHSHYQPTQEHHNQNIHDSLTNHPKINFATPLDIDMHPPPTHTHTYTQP